jgi:LysR family transcriptional regulator (chromosome initiation inhibitor)
MMRLQLDQLETLRALVEEGTFDAAARRLHVTASAISQRVKAMEDSAGQVLVQRTNPVRPTAAGDIVLRYARQVQLLEADTERELHGGLRGARSIPIPLAVNSDSLATWFLEAIAGLPGRLDLVFDLYRDDQEHTTSLLRSGTVMAAVTSTPEAVQGCSSQKLGIMRYRAVCSPVFANRWLDLARPLDRLAEAPMVEFDRKDDLQRRFLRDRVGTTAHPARHYVPTSADFARALVFGFGWGLLPEQQCRAELADGRLVELAPEHPIDVRLYWQRWNLGSPLLDAVSDAVRAGAAADLYPM